VQDTDVLDTWFSSALWPFSTMGWPERTPLLEIFYPTSVLVTGFDILFFWVARMMMMGLHFMDDVPFRDVYVHALVRDEDGKKMSKSKGNVIDPLSVIDTYGTDAFRFTLAAFAAQGRDIKMSEKRIEGYRHFINKLWNAARLCLMHLTERQPEAGPDSRSLPDRWILSRLHALTGAVSDAIEGYRFNEAAGALYNFVWHEFCDWYLEAIKPVLYDKRGADQKAATLAVLRRVLGDTLILLHPFIPFVTEEIWHKLPGAEGSLMRAVHPLDGTRSTALVHDHDAESQMTLVTDIITGVRNIRGEMGLPPALELAVELQSEDETVRATVADHQDIILNLARVKALSIVEPGKKPASAATTIIEGGTLFVPLEGIIDFEKEAERLQKRINKVNADLLPVVKKLNNEDFLKKAPAQVVAGAREKQELLHLTLHKLESTLNRVRELAE
jgi:valyl-tRNA synthetase